MKITVRHLFILAVSFYLSSCSTENKENRVERTFDQTFQLVKQDSLILKLDTLSGIGNIEVNTFQQGNERFVTLFNPIAYRVYIYRMGISKPFRVIKLEREGPNGVGKLNSLSCEAFFLDSSQLFVHNYFEQRLYRLNSKGEVLDKFKINNIKNVGLSVAALNYDQYAVHDNKLYFPCTPNRFKYLNSNDMRSIGRLDMENGKIDYLAAWPEEYIEGYFLGPLKYTPFIEKKGNGNILLSFPVSEYIYEVDQEGSVKAKHYVSSENYTPIEPFMPLKDYIEAQEDGKLNTMIPRGKSREYSVTTPLFLYIFSLPESGHFIRIYNHAIPKGTYSRLKDNIPPYDFSCIITDSNFQYLGETTLNFGEHSLLSSFSDGNSLYFLRKNIDKEGFLVFDRFMPNKL